jgi:hypothetical protein
MLELLKIAYILNTHSIAHIEANDRRLSIMMFILAFLISDSSSIRGLFMYAFTTMFIFTFRR